MEEKINKKKKSEPSKKADSGNSSVDTSKYYFNETHEKALIRFLDSKSQDERSLIYRRELEKPFKTLVELIIKKYKLYIEGETFSETVDDALINIFSIIQGFDRSLGTKGFSYFGTITYRYLINRRKDIVKKKKRDASYEEEFLDIVDREDLCYNMDDELEFDYKNYIKKLQKELEVYIKNNRFYLTEDEKKVGAGLIFVLENWDGFLPEMVKSKKYNKGFVQGVISDFSNVDRKKINQCLKKFKEVNKLFQKVFLN